MKKIIRHPAVDAVLTLILAYVLVFHSWYLSDFLIFNIPGFLGIDLYSMMGEDLFITWYFYFIFISVWICGLVIIALFKGYRPMLKAFSPKLKGNNIKSALTLGLALGMGLNLLIALAAMAAGSIKIHYVGMGPGVFILLLTAVFIQSGAEELVARVFIYQRLRKDFPKWPAVAILGNGLFFFLMHISNPGMTAISSIMMVLVAVLYSLVVYYFDSIWIPIVAHATWNFTQSIILGLSNSGIVLPASIFYLDAATDSFAYDPTFGIEGSILSFVLNLAVCLAIFYFGRKKGALETNIWSEEA